MKALIRKIWITALPLLFLPGCGGSGQDFAGFGRSLGGDLSSGYNNSLGSRYGGENGRAAAGVLRGTYPMIETAFKLDKLPGDPFDYEKVSVTLTLRKPDGKTVDAPCFFDGDSTWKMRYTPSEAGAFSVTAVKLNNETISAAKPEPKEWTVKGDPEPGFIRVDKGDSTRFVFDSGSRYYPIGHNQAWRTNNQPDIPELFAKMGGAGENWSRVWMNHWDGKNLDWDGSGKSVKPGEIDLNAAKRWDEIVAAAGKSKIYFQLVLQHHGQYASKADYRYSSNVNPNWEQNPYNAKNGGFLKNPEDFFTDPQARALTKRKLYYILARWGYSPNILSWELFNEVEHTDAARGKLWTDIAQWHREMALFLRRFDGYRHLITTSSAPSVPTDSPIWETVDYLQTHTYPPDVLTALGGDPDGLPKQKKPWFVGEYGAQELRDPQGLALHNGLWVSLMRHPSGAAQYWDWDSVEKNDHYGHFKAATSFLTASGTLNQGGLTVAAPPVQSEERATLRFAPGGGWAKATQHEFILGKSGLPAGLAAFPSYLYGTSKRDMMPKPLTFQVNYERPGTFAVTVGQVAKQGGKLTLKADDKSAERDYPAGQADYNPKGEEATLSIEVPAGAHTITVENTGVDWLLIKEFALSGYAPALAAHARIGKEFAIAWVYHRGNATNPATDSLPSATGKLTLSGLKPGKYAATWWDTRQGKPLDTAEVTVGKEKEGVVLTTPSVVRDVALYLTKPNALSASEKPKKEKNAPTPAALNAPPR